MDILIAVIVIGLLVLAIGSVACYRRRRADRLYVEEERRRSEAWLKDAERLTHDFRRRFWGHNITWFSPGAQIKGHLWFNGTIVVDDYLIMPNGTEHGSRYRVTKIERMRDPDDMFAYEAEHDPRTEAEL